jgi:hypothetical protein
VRILGYLAFVTLVGAGTPSAASCAKIILIPVRIRRSIKVKYLMNLLI